jgi:hypothetical protein
MRNKPDCLNHQKELNMKKHILSTVLITLISTTALAQEIAVITFDNLDSNKDDGLSAAEAGALPEISEQWSTLDVDANGKLSRVEFASYEMPAPAAGIK